MAQMSPEDALRILNAAAPEVLVDAIAQMSNADRDALERRIREAHELRAKRYTLYQLEALAANNRFFHGWFAQNQWMWGVTNAVFRDDDEELTQADVAKYLVATLFKMSPLDANHRDYEKGVRMIFDTMAAELREHVLAQVDE